MGSQLEVPNDNVFSRSDIDFEYAKSDLLNRWGTFFLPFAGIAATTETT